MTATPGTWKLLMDRAGIGSIRQLAKAAGLADHTIINRVIMKGTTTSAENMEKVAAVLRVPVEQLYGITSGAPTAPLKMPAGTEKLTERQKIAVAEMIRTLVEGREDIEKLVDKKSAEPTEPAQEKNPGRLMSAQEEHDLAARRELFKRPVRARAKPTEKLD